EDEKVEVRAGALDHRDDVVVCPARVGAVDAHGAELLSPVELAQGPYDVVAGGLLLRRRHRVLEIEEDEIRIARRGLVDHLLARGGGGALGSSQPDAHGLSFRRSISGSASSSAVRSPRTAAPRETAAAPVAR